MSFSSHWFNEASDDDLADEREAVRLQYVAARDIKTADELYDLLHQFDEEMIRRSNKKYERENPNPQPRRHREHGWYLPNDE